MVFLLTAYLIVRARSLSAWSLSSMAWPTPLIENHWRSCRYCIGSAGCRSIHNYERSRERSVSKNRGRTIRVAGQGSLREFSSGGKPGQSRNPYPYDYSSGEVASFCILAKAEILIAQVGRKSRMIWHSCLIHRYQFKAYFFPPPYYCSRANLLCANGTTLRLF